MRSNIISDAHGERREAKKTEQRGGLDRRCLLDRMVVAPYSDLCREREKERKRYLAGSRLLSSQSRKGGWN